MALTITPAQMRETEQRFMQERGIPGLLLMEHAAQGVAEALADMAPRGKPVLFLCGPGNNGGDGYAAARLWRARGGEALIWELSSQPRGNAGVTRQLALDAGIPIRPVTEEVGELPLCGAVVDALFGTGLDRAPAGRAEQLIRRVNAAHLPVLAVDIPSGLRGDTGEASPATIRAAATVTFHRVKTGLLLGDACRYTGRLICRPILIPEADGCPKGLYHLRRSELDGLIPERGADSHKGNWGRAVLLAGSEGMAGAAALCAMGCIRGGCGLTTVLCPAPVLPVVQKLVPGATAVPLTGDPEKDAALARQALARADRAAVGCGLGTDEGRVPLLRAFREAACPVVWDADALNLLARHPELLPLKPEDVITPHPGEAARLLGTEPDRVTEEPLVALGFLRARCGCRVILKGARSLMTDGAHVAVNPIGTPALAKGGSGDLLTGLLTALIRRTRESELRPLEELQAACYFHALAGMRAEKRCGADCTAPEEVAAAIRLDAADFPELTP